MSQPLRRPSVLSERICYDGLRRPMTVEKWVGERLPLVREQRVWLRRTFPSKGRAPGVSALCCPRGMGKTTIGAALLSAALHPDGPLFRAGCENVLMAGSFDQARFLFGALREFLQGDVWKWADSLSQMRVLHRDTRTACRVISSRGKTALGIRDARLIVGDEPASWDPRNGAMMFDAVTTSAGKTEQSALFLGTLSPCDNPSGWWPTLVDGGSESGTHVTLLQGPEDWPVTWSQVAKCNPLVRVNPRMKDTLRGELRGALGDPSKRRKFRAYRLNVLTASDDREVLIELPEWRVVLARPVPEREGRPVLAIDTGESRSMSAVVSLWPNGLCEALARLPGLPSIEEQEARDTVEPGTYSKLVRGRVLSVDEGRHVVDVSGFVDDVLVCCPGNTHSNTCDLVDDRLRRGDPDERRGRGIVAVDERLDLAHQIRDAAERAPLDRPLAEQAEPPLHLVQPGRVGGREVQVEARPRSQPLPDLGVLVRRIVVQHEVDVQFRRHLPVDQPQERQELLVTVPLPTLGQAPARWQCPGRQTTSSCRAGRSRGCSLRRNPGPSAASAGCD